jgi:hypothetical protein
MQLANYDLRMTAGRPRYPIMFRVSGYSHKSYFTLATVPGLASLTLSPKGSLSYIYPNRDLYPLHIILKKGFFFRNVSQFVGFTVLRQLL